LQAGLRVGAGCVCSIIRLYFYSDGGETSIPQLREGLAMPRGRIAGNYSISDLQSMIEQRRTEVAKLRKQRTRLQREMNQIDHRMAVLDGAAGSRGRGGGARNAKSLIVTMQEVLAKAGKPIPISEIVSRVQHTGYRSDSANFRGIVNQTLIKDKRFSAAGRGVYELKK
jgi:hypothetical protein